MNISPTYNRKPPHPPLTVNLSKLFTIYWCRKRTGTESFYILWSVSSKYVSSIQSTCLSPVVSCYFKRTKTASRTPYASAREAMSISKHILVHACTMQRMSSGLKRWLYHEEAGILVVVLFTHECDGLCPTDLRITCEKPVLGWLILCVNYSKNVPHFGPSRLERANATS